MRLLSSENGVGGRGPRVSALCAVSLALLLPCGVSVAAQSGRRAQRPAASTPPGEEAPNTPTTRPAAKPSPETAGPKRDLKGVTLLVSAEIKSDASDRAYSIFSNFVAHLANAGAKVATLGASKREEAVKRAKSEAEAYVVWLQLEKDSFQRGSVVINSPDLVVKYTVFAPGTGESKAKGKVYYQAMAGPRGRAGSSDPVKITAEAAGVEAAERVMDWFTLERQGARLERP